MSSLYLFAPENDMALAFGGKHYTPTPVALKIAQDLSLLPLWYAQDANDYVWTPQEVPACLTSTLDALGITARAVQQPPLHIDSCRPWGWSPYIVERMRRAGVPARLLPNEDALTRLRDLSGRATSRILLQALMQEDLCYPMPPLPRVLSTAEAVEEYVTSQPASMLKSPWSSSGRGVWCVRNGYDSVTARSASGIIRKQGYIMGERLQDKICDLAMEFYSDGVEARFAGYSLFETDDRGAYRGNILDTNDAIEQQLSTHIAPMILQTTRVALERILTRHIAPHYKGFMGIDMITYRGDDGMVLLHPCIELNLRMSMGMVARIIADRYLSASSSGIYRVDYQPDSAALQQLHNTLRASHPLCIHNQRVVEGYLPLTPITPHSHYVAYIVVKKR